MARCTHFQMITGAPPHTPASCEECVREGTRWLKLRLCLTCGHVGCSDESPGHHALEHFRATAHPLVRGFDAGDYWGSCYRDRVRLDMGELLPGRSQWPSPMQQLRDVLRRARLAINVQRRGEIGG
jgi:hypothetical protein